MASKKKSRWFSTPADARHRKALGLTLSPKALDRLEKMSLSRGLSRSAIVEELVMSAPVRKG